MILLRYYQRKYLEDIELIAKEDPTTQRESRNQLISDMTEETSRRAK
jgi:hypothetical protein